MSKFRLWFILIYFSYFMLGCSGGGGDGGGGGGGSISLSAVAVTPSQINLSWTPAPGVVSGYHVYRDGANINGYILNGHSYPDTDVPPGTSHCYQVQAVTFPIGVTDSSNVVCLSSAGLSSGWTMSNIGTGAVNGQPSLARDSANHLHTVFYDGTLRYATNAAGAWNTVTVDSSPGAGYAASIAIDSENSAHIIYYVDGYVKYATNRGGPWSFFVISAGGNGSIALDSLDHVHISYMKDNAIYYATNETGSWLSTYLMGYSSGQFVNTSIAVDAARRVHIAFVISEYLGYWSNATGSWQETWVDSTVASGTSCAIVTDAAGFPYISYWKTSPFQLIIASNPGGFWDKVVVDSSDWMGGDTALAVDESGRLHVSYRDRNADLKYANNTSGGWNAYYIDAVGNVGRHNSIVVDQTGRVHITYNDETNGIVKYATK